MKKLYKFGIILFLSLSLPETQAQVCTFAGAECCGEGITNFQLNGTPAINRTSTVNENSGFTNTGDTTTLVMGQSYNVSVTFPLETVGIVDCNTYNFKIFIDYNSDDELTDSGEEVVFLADKQTGTHTASFIVPTTATVGNTYMRVMMKMSATSLSGGFCGHSPITACNNPADPVGFHGEVENYTVNIQAPATGMESVSNFSLFSIFPNPFSEQTEITFYNPSSIPCTFVLYDILGNTIKSFPISGNKAILQRGNISAGIYFYELKEKEGKKTTGKLIVH